MNTGIVESIVDRMIDEKEMVVVDTRHLIIGDDVLDVVMSQAVIDKIRQHFGLLDSQPVEDDHVRMYVLGAVQTAVVKAEQELQDVEQPRGTADTVRKPHC